jgi:predicted Zn-dependent protease
MNDRSNRVAVVLAVSMCFVQSMLTAPSAAQGNPAPASQQPNAQAAPPASPDTQGSAPPSSTGSHKKEWMSDYQKRHKDEGYYEKNGPKKKKDDMSDYQRRHDGEGYYQEIKPYAPAPPTQAELVVPMTHPIQTELPPLQTNAVSAPKEGERKLGDDTGATGSVSATRHAKQAKDDFAAGRYPQAIGHFRASLDAFPNQPDLYPDYFEALRKGNDWSEVKITLEKWFQIAPDKKKDYSWCIGEALYNLRNYDKAREALTDSLKYGVKLDEVHNLLLKIALAQHNNADAESQYAALLKIKPSDYQTQISFANMLELQGKHADALAHYKAAVNLQPSDGALAARVAYMLMYYNKDYTSAIGYYKKAMAADPGNASKYAENIRFAESQMPHAAAKKVQQ